MAGLGAVRRAQLGTAVPARVGEPPEDAIVAPDEQDRFAGHLDSPPVTGVVQVLVAADVDPLVCEQATSFVREDTVVQVQPVGQRLSHGRSLRGHLARGSAERGRQPSSQGCITNDCDIS